MNINYKTVNIILAIIFFTSCIFLLNNFNTCNTASIFVVGTRAGSQEGDLKYCSQGYTMKDDICQKIDQDYFDLFQAKDYVDIKNLNKFIGKEVTTHGYIASVKEINNEKYLFFCKDYPNQCLVTKAKKNFLDAEYFYNNKNIKLSGIVSIINNDFFNNTLYLAQTDLDHIRVFNKETNIFDLMPTCECSEWEDIEDPTTTREKQVRVCHPQRCNIELQYK